MNKKLLMATMSLVALAACTDNDFQSQNQKMAEEVSPVQFEIVNGNDAMTRATLPVNTIVWSAEDKDLFTLYHGGTLNEGSLIGLGNATYTATPVDGEPAVLTTPSMINAGKAIMVWPVDTTFRCEGNNLMIDIPAVQNPSKKGEKDQGLANIIPYVSDLIEISPYIIAGTETTAERPSTEADFNRAGYNRKYPVYMRPMASQLNLHTDYQYASEESENAYKALVEDTDDPIEEIYATSVALITDADKFTTKIPVIFAAAGEPKKALWDAKVAENAWTHVTGLDIANIPNAGKVNRLETTCPISTGALKDGCKFLILPQSAIEGGVDKGAIEVNTYYGSVLVAKKADYPESKYTDAEYNAAWYRLVTTRLVDPTDEENASVATDLKDSKNRPLWKTVAKSPALGMQQTINTFSTYIVPDLNNNDVPVADKSIVAGEYMGVASDRYLNVNLQHLDMSNLHIKTDKQLRDVVRVWKALGLDGVTVFLDDDKDANDAEDEDDDFHISQKTIEAINNANKNKTFANWFKVKPCKVEGEAITKIVITGSSTNQKVQDIAFIASNPATDPAAKAEVVFANEGDATPWIWEKDVKVTAAGVSRFINEGTMLNAATETLRTLENDGTQNYVPLINYGTWNIGVEGQTEGTRLNVQFGVTNMGLVTINKKAQYIQDKTTFNNGASTLPERFLAAGVEEKFGEVDNFGVFATVNNGTINNVGLIEHADKDAKTYITRNQSANDGVNFANPFAGNNKMGTISLPYSNKEEDNISISAELAEGFVSVTISDTPATEAPAGGILNEAVVGHKVNYVNIVGGVTEIQQLPAQIKYVEINEPGTEIVWNLVDDPTTVDNPETQEVENDESVATYEGLIVLSDVNIKLNTTIKVTKACYLGADMYVGGYFNPDRSKAQLKTWTGWKGYYGDTTTNFESQYITY